MNEFTFVSDIKEFLPFIATCIVSCHLMGYVFNKLIRFLGGRFG
jgi:hypothetical protein